MVQFQIQKFQKKKKTKTKTGGSDWNLQHGRISSSDRAPVCRAVGHGLNPRQITTIVRLLQSLRNEVTVHPLPFKRLDLPVSCIDHVETAVSFSVGDITPMCYMCYVLLC